MFFPIHYISKSLSCILFEYNALFYHYFKPTFVLVCPKFQQSVCVPQRHHPKNSMKNAVGAGRVHTSR